MREVFLGEAIKRRRLELKMTQERLCEGICEPITISRLENGKQTPSRNRINAILERLGMPSDRFYALLSKNELELEEKQKQIVSLNVQFGQASDEDRMTIRAQVLEAHRALEAIMEDDDMISRQLLLRSHIILGKEDGSHYSLAEKKKMLLDAIRLTNPSFDPDEINRGLYTVEEIKIINQLATSYARSEDHMEAINILRQLYQYIKKHYQNIPSCQSQITMVSYNYSRELCMVGQYEKAIEIAEEGRRASLTSGHHLSLSGLLSIQAESYHFLGNDAKSRELYQQCFYLCKAMEDDRNAFLTQQDARRYVNLELK